MTRIGSLSTSAQIEDVIAAGLPSASGSTLGGVRIAGDLGGSAASPMVKSRHAYTIAPSGYTGAADAVCDGTADDVEINAAIAAGYATIVLLPGTYNTTAKIELSPNGGNVALIAMVPGTVTIQGANTDYTIMGTTKDASGLSNTLYQNITIRGIKIVSQRGSCLTISNTLNALVEDVHLGFSATPLVRQALTFLWCKNAKARKITINTTAGNGVSFNGCVGGGLGGLDGYGGAEADDMVDVDSDFNDTNTVISTDITLSNINVDTVAKGNGIRIEHAHNVSLTNFNVKNVTALNSAGLYINTGSTFNQKDIVVTGGTIQGCTENGIVTEGSATENVSISNVIVRASGMSGGSGVRAGVRIGSPNTNVSNVIVDGSTKSGGDGAGILIYTYDTTIRNCVVKNCVTGLRAWNGDSLQSYASTVVEGIRYSGNTTDEVVSAFTGASRLARNYGQAAYTSSLNQFLQTQSVAGNSPVESVDGPDTNINMIRTTKGTGRHIFRPGSDATNAFSVQNAAGSSTYLDVDTTNGRVGVLTTTPTSRFFVAGSIGFIRSTINDASVTLNADQCYMAFSAQTAARTITLPSATSNAGRIYIIADELGTAATYSINVATTLSQTIDGGTSMIINKNFGFVGLISVGGGWKVIFGDYVNKRVATLTASGSTYTPAGDTTDEAKIISPSADFTISAPTGTPTDRQNLVITIKSDATGRTPTFNAVYISSGVATLPSSALPASKTVTLGFTYDSDASKWVLRAIDDVGY